MLVYAFNLYLLPCFVGGKGGGVKSCTRLGLSPLFAANQESNGWLSGLQPAVKNTFR